MSHNYTRVEEIRLPVFQDGKQRGFEVIPVRKTGQGTFIVLASPGLAEGFAAGDELAFDDASKRRFRVIRRGGNLCIWCFFKDTASLEKRKNLLEQSILSLGGKLDGGLSNMIIITISVAVGFPKIEGVLRKLEQEIDNFSWFYGNVYEPEDGVTPLNWW